MTSEVALLMIGAYVLGAIPFGVLVARAVGGVDITKLGSGNIGATNVHRALGWKAGLPVLVFDICKGLVPPLLARILQLSLPSLSVVDVALLAGFAAVLGHCASPFLKFKGGKGVATICGAAIGATPLIALVGVSVFAIVVIATRYISLASILGVFGAVVAALLLRYDGLVVGAFIAIWLFIMYKHRANIRRLMKGEEPKFNLKGGKEKGSIPNPPESSEKPADRKRNSDSEDEKECV